jgi:hypothetical protein
LRFAVRRPATRPASPRGHRPPGGDVLALRAGPAGGLAGTTDASLAERTRNDGVRDLPPYGRMSLARVLLGPEGADLDLVPPTGRSRDHRAPAAPAPVRPALTGVLAGTADGPWAPAANGMGSGPAVAGSSARLPVVAGRAVNGVASGSAVEPPAHVPAAAGTPAMRLGSGPVAGLSARLSVVAGRAANGVASGPAVEPPARVPAVSGTSALDLAAGPEAAGEGPEVLTPTRVMAGRPAAWASGETDHRLGETTGTLLLRHLAKDAPRPPGRPGLSRPPTLDAPSTIPEIPRRERRPLAGRKAGALTPRTR